MHPAATAHRRAVAARPIGPWLPAALRVPLIDLVHRNTGHRCAEATADLGKDVGVTEVRRRLDDGLGAWCRIVTLEDARPDEHRFGAELHGQRRVGRRGDATRAEQRHWKPTGFGDLLHQRKWGLQLRLAEPQAMKRVAYSAQTIALAGAAELFRGHDHAHVFAVAA